MGKSAAAQQLSKSGLMEKANSNSKTRKVSFYILLFTFFVCFAVNSFAQNTLEILAEQITRGNTEQKRNALFQIRNLETAEASRLAVPALQDKSEIVRATAVQSVVFLPPDEAVQILLPFLSDKKPFVRKETAYALGKTRNPNAIRPLVETIQKDKIQEVKDAATVALGEIGDASAVDALMRILQRQPKNEEEFMRRSAARSIGQIAQIIQTGETRILSPESFLPEKYTIVKINKYPNLIVSYRNFRQAVSVLIQTIQSLREFDDVKREAAFALGAIGDTSAIPVLQSNLNAEDYYLAEICKESLKIINNR